ncbi:MAG: efflux RND transporter periplasmic adaptor subunit [Lachnospiraceae bacterium]|nr:efflux RND transporter periplasmic adaptor subunit [Lachnospiraceae bacterium]
MKKALVTVLILGLLGAGGYGVYHHFFENTGETERVSSDAENAVYVDQISAITGFGSGNGLVNRFGGEIKPQATLEVKLENDRTVKECFVKEGDEVKEGQRLFVYDTQDDEDKLAQAEIDIEKAEGDIEVAEKSIKSYEKDKANATNSDDQLMATSGILSAQNDIKKSEYEIKSKKLEMEKLRQSIANATVTAEMAGIVQKISDSSSSDAYSYGYGSSGNENVYITILAAGDFRVKGKINEQNLGQIDVGTEMIVYSRVDSSLTWKGVVSEVNTDNKEEENSDNMYYYSGMSSDSGSSNYAFYVDLENSEGLILGQHVYMEPDEGQNDKKDGLWLEDYYIMQEDGKAYVWMANASNVIEKHEITLGEYDEELMKYEVTDGLGAEDYIAYPTEMVEEGVPVIYNDFSDGQNAMDMGDDPAAWEGMDGMGNDEEMGMEEDVSFGEDISDPGAGMFGLNEDMPEDMMGPDGEEIYDADEEN